METVDSIEVSASQTAPREYRRASDPLPQLIERLKDRSTCLRALNEVARLGPLALDALPWLRDLLTETDPRILAAAARAVGHIGYNALPAMLELMSHSEKVVRREIVWALARLGVAAKPALPVLCRALQDSDPRTAAGAAQCLANMGPAAEPAIPDLINALDTANLIQSRLIAKALSDIGPKALPALIAAVDDSRPFVRHEAIVAIGFMGMRAGSAVPVLINRLQRLCHSRQASSAENKIDDSSQTVATEVFALTVDPLQEILSIIDTLKRMGPAAAAARTVLQNALHDSDPKVSQAASEALLQIAGWH
jgi:HEAT repeat protein